MYRFIRDEFIDNLIHGHCWEFLDENEVPLYEYAFQTRDFFAIEFLVHYDSGLISNFPNILKKNIWFLKSSRGQHIIQNIKVFPIVDIDSVRLIIAVMGRRDSYQRYLKFHMELLYNGYHIPCLSTPEEKNAREQFRQCRNTIVRLLALKQRRIPSMVHLDRFLVRELAVQVYITRYHWPLKPPEKEYPFISRFLILTLILWCIIHVAQRA